MKHLFSLLLCLFCLRFSGQACSLCKITQNGRTVVGNNEDWWNPQAQVRFAPKEKGRYGYLAVGFNDNLVQGAVNEGGLMFDAFATPYKASKDTGHKRAVEDSVAIDTIMRTFSTVRQVKAYLSKVDLSTLTRVMLVFIDNSGEYLRVESDELFLGCESLQTFSNFYPSLTPNPATVALPYYQSGCRFLNQTHPKATIDYCARVMDNFKQNTTQYTTVYDLKNGVVRLYAYHDFSRFVELRLTAELAKGRRTVPVSELLRMGKVR